MPLAAIAMLGAIALALPLVVACGTGGPQTARAIEEAKQVTAGFTATLWAPPSRTIGDVTAILDQQQLADPEGVARARARADQRPPATGDADALARFYHQRGLAAGQLGRARQEIDDLTEAARWTARGAGRAEHEILLWLGIAEITGGNFSRGIDDARRAITKVPGTQKGWLVALNGIIASAHARAGDLAAAEAALAQSLRAYDESKRWWIFYPADALAAMNAGLLEAQAGLAMARGRFAEAETLYRRAVAAFQDDAVMSRHPWLDYLTGRVAESLVRQGRVLEAENEARAALRGVVSKRGRDAAPTGNLLTILAHVLAEQGRFDDVEMLARTAIDVYQRAGTPADSLLRAVARTWLGAALVAQGRWHEALAEYEAIRGGMAGDPESYGRFLAGDFGWALALLHTGRADRAIEILEVARARSEGLGEKYATTAQVRGFLAMAYAARGERPRAHREFAAAVPDLLTRALEVDEEAMSRPMRDRLLELILTSYIGLLADLRATPLEQEVGIDAVAEAFRLADAARARSVQRALKTLDLARYRVLAFATHGLVPGDLDGLTQPGLALTAPEVAQVDGDGLLTMEEILGLRLNADWVVLSACNTASGRGAGAEAVSGLGRAFFFAGARALLVSHWPVETTSARFLTTDLFQTQRNNPGLGRARALQQTMNAAIDEGRFRHPTTGQAVYSYAHPIFWAPFTLVGDGGGGAAP